MSRTPPSVWAALAAAKTARARSEILDDYLANRDDDIGDELATRDDGPEPPEAA